MVSSTGWRESDYYWRGWEMWNVFVSLMNKRMEWRENVQWQALQIVSHGWGTKGNKCIIVYSSKVRKLGDTKVKDWVYNIGMRMSMDVSGVTNAGQERMGSACWGAKLIDYNCVSSRSMWIRLNVSKEWLVNINVRAKRYVWRNLESGCVYQRRKCGCVGQFECNKEICLAFCRFGVIRLSEGVESCGHVLKAACVIRRLLDFEQCIVGRW